MIRFDGIEATAIIDAAPGNLNGEIPSPFKLQSSLENVQEFRVDSSSYPGRVRNRDRRADLGGHEVRQQYRPRLRRSTTSATTSSISKNAFDLQKSPLSLKQFGGSVGGPIAKNRAFFFGSYEGYRLESGINFIEGVPSAAAFQRAVPAIQPLFRRVPRPRRGRPAGRVGKPRLRHPAAAVERQRPTRTRWPRAST